MIPGFPPGWRGFYFRQAITLCCTLYFAALCWLGLGWSFWLGLNHDTQGMGALPDPGCSRNTGDLLTPQQQPCSAGFQSIPTGENSPLKGSVSSFLPCKDGTRGGAGMGWLKEGGIPHLAPGHNRDPQGKQGREALTELP